MRILLAILSALGIIVSSLALRVNHSHFAVVHGIPVALIGIVGYTLLMVLAAFGLRRLLLVSAVIGLCYALYLTHIEHDLLQVWCLYCVCSQGIIALIALLGAGWVAFGRRRRLA
jgi:vitamin-K-epoxide reductase (warfarin-sensitive)